MMYWNTEKIKEILSKIPNIKLLEISHQGSEMTTEQLTYAINGANDHLYVRGFVTEHKNQISNAKDTEIEMIEVFTNYSDGEDSPEVENVIARGLIMGTLIKAGYHSIVRSLEPYF